MSFLHLYAFSRLNYLLALILVLPLLACSAGDGDLNNSSSTNSSTKLSWVAPSEREGGEGLSLSEIAGFRIYYGSRSGDYSTAIDIGDHAATQVVLDGLPSGTYFVVVTTVDTNGLESSYSDEVVFTV